MRSAQVDLGSKELRIYAAEILDSTTKSAHVSIEEMQRIIEKITCYTCRNAGSRLAMSTDILTDGSGTWQQARLMHKPQAYPKQGFQRTIPLSYHLSDVPMQSRVLACIQPCIGRRGARLATFRARLCSM